MSKKLDLTGQKFGRLVVIKDVGQNSGDRQICECLCICGKQKNIPTYNLTIGKTKSCGCLREEIVSKRMTTHKMSKFRFYKIFSLIKNRCENIKTTNYKYYGNRGIKCLWKSFENFRNDMYIPYQEHIKLFGEKNTTIDRVDNDGDYCKENCRWATLKEQARNHRNNKLITFNGETRCITEWAEKIGIEMGTLHRRLTYTNWTVEKSLTTPVN